MTITGTVYNELRLPATKAKTKTTAETEAKAETETGTGTEIEIETTRRQQRKPRWRRARPPRVRQHEPGGGGRSIPQHRRMYAQVSEPTNIKPIEQRTEDGFRRTWLRRTPAEVAAAGRRLGQDVTEMIGADVYPEPSDQNCPPCPFLDPCQAIQAGRDPGPIIRAGYRRRPPPRAEEGRLGGRAGGLGRGAAPPRFQPRRNG